jgi:hypothetical protein
MVPREGRSGVGRGHNRENHIYMCLYWKKKIFSKTSWPISIKLGINHPWVKGILIFPIKGQILFKEEIFTKMQNSGMVENHRTRIGHIYMKVFRYNIDSTVFKSWSPGVGRGHNRENHIHLCLYRKNKSSPEPARPFQSNFLQIILG